MMMIYSDNCDLWRALTHKPVCGILMDDSPDRISQMTNEIVNANEWFIPVAPPGGKKALYGNLITYVSHKSPKNPIHGRTDERMERRKDGRTDGWKDGRTDIHCRDWKDARWIFDPDHFPAMKILCLKHCQPEREFQGAPFLRNHSSIAFFFSEDGR